MAVKNYSDTSRPSTKNSRKLIFIYFGVKADLPVYIVNGQILLVIVIISVNLI